MSEVKKPENLNKKESKSKVPATETKNKKSTTTKTNTQNAEKKITPKTSNSKSSSKVASTTNTKKSSSAKVAKNSENKTVAKTTKPSNKVANVEEKTSSVEKKSTITPKKTSTTATKKSSNNIRTSASKTNTKKATTNKSASVTKNKEKTSEIKTNTKKVKQEKVEIKEIAPKETKKVKTVEVKENTKEITTNKEIKEEIKPKESAIISKIKSFLRKIVELQEEAKKEKIEKKEQEAKELAKKENKEIEIEKRQNYNIEYYDLPYRYNETVVKILAQTPKRLFVYWDIADSDRERYVKVFGENFFNETYPVLLIHNEDKNYTFEIPINDFANSWYLDINDSKSKYTIQLGRKFRDQSRTKDINYEKINNENIIIQNDYLPITTSNILEVPNDHILFENLRPYVVYRNVKTYEEKVVDISNLEFAKKMGKIYNIYDIYKEIYKNEMEDNSLLDLLNPSSMSSSTFK